MSEYLNLSENNIMTILLPIHMLVFNVLFFVKNYYKEKFSTCVILSVLTGICGGISFYLLNYDNYFIATWITNFVIAPFFYGFLIIGKPIKGNLFEINVVEKVLYLFEGLVGVALIILPFTNIFILIGGGNNWEVDIVSKMLICLLGVCYICLNKYTINKFKNF